jgi:hypothetical protein
MTDNVNRPSHYNKGGIECIDAIREALGDEGFKAYCRGNAIKYTWRAGLKLNEKEDLLKASWYNRMAAGDDPRHEKPDMPNVKDYYIPIPSGLHPYVGPLYTPYTTPSDTGTYTTPSDTGTVAPSGFPNDETTDGTKPQEFPIFVKKVCRV